MLRSPLGNENMRLLRRSASQGKNFKEFPNTSRSQNTMSFLKQSLYPSDKYSHFKGLSLITHTISSSIFNAKKTKKDSFVDEAEIEETIDFELEDQQKTPKMTAFTEK